MKFLVKHRKHGKHVEIDDSFSRCTKYQRKIFISAATQSTLNPLNAARALFISLLRQIVLNDDGGVHANKAVVLFRSCSINDLVSHCVVQDCNVAVVLSAM